MYQETLLVTGAAGGVGSTARVAIAILLSLVAAAYPAWRSTRVEPVEGLRHE